MTARNPITFVAGDSHVVRVTVSERVNGATSPMDISGASAVLSVKASPTDATYLLQKACSITDGPEGVLEAAFAPADTSELAPGRYVYDVQVTTIGLAVYTVVVDSFELTAGITD